MNDSAQPEPGLSLQDLLLLIGEKEARILQLSRENAKLQARLKCWPQAVPEPEKATG